MKNDTSYKLAIIWPGYRKNNELFFKFLANEPRLKLKVVWIRDFRKDDMPSHYLLSSFDWKIVGAKNIRINGYSIRTFFKMVNYVYKAVHWGDAVLTSTQAPLHSKVAFIISKFFKKKVFIVLEQWKEILSPSFLFKLYKRYDNHILKNCDAVFCHGKNQKKFAQIHGVPESKIKFLPFLSNDLSKIPFTEDIHMLKKKLGIENKKVILYFGRITPQKGLKDLIYACYKIKDHVNFVLLICGGSDPHFLDYSEANSYEKECKKLAQKLLSKKAIFTGYIKPKDKQNYFALGDIFVHPHTNFKNLYEGWGLVINEAASMSLPIITTDRVGSAPDFVINGKNGYIVKAGNVEELAFRIKEILTDETKQRRFSLCSRKIFESYHKPHKIPKTILKVLDEG